MKYIKLFDNFNSKNKNIKTLFHGGHEENLKNPQLYLFFSESKDFSKDFGYILFEVIVDLGKVFDSLSIKDIQLLYDNDFKLEDQYIEQMVEFGNEDVLDIDGYDYDNNYYITPEAFLSSPYTSDTWESIEKTYGVVDWIFSKYDSILITEGGCINYYTSTQNVLSYKKFLNNES